MKILCFLALTILVHSFSIVALDDVESISASQDDPNYLTFTYTRGLRITDAQVTALKVYIGNATLFYGPNPLDNLRYIVTQFNNYYPQNFGLFIQPSPKIYSNYKVDTLSQQTYLSFGPGSNSYQPEWSYLLVSNYRYKSLPFVDVVNISKGTGYNSSEVQAITYAVSSFDGPTGACYCNKGFFDSLVQSISALANNVICSDQLTYGYFSVENDRWLAIKPRNCYYIIWAN